jgi:hypothetical protein
VTWEWTNNNTTETPPYGGGYITITVNTVPVVSEYDTTSTSTAVYSGSFNVNPGDYVGISVYSYANNTAGTQTFLAVESPIGTTIYNNSDGQTNPGSPSSEGYAFYASDDINIVAQSASY